ncbi:hypothetical protein R3P38DRAFT_1345562 [Favolaschia claudopus]|uniref:Uncharacterized protein n=1 Tax=Favolaschia claudopus TaxID=2862362 RepID=A0AAW0DUR4_9AGAR
MLKIYNLPSETEKMAGEVQSALSGMAALLLRHTVEKELNVSFSPAMGELRADLRYVAQTVERSGKWGGNVLPDHSNGELFRVSLSSVDSVSSGVLLVGFKSDKEPGLRSGPISSNVSLQDAEKKFKTRRTAFTLTNPYAPTYIYTYNMPPAPAPQVTTGPYTSFDPFHWDPFPMPTFLVTPSAATPTSSELGRSFDPRCPCRSQATRLGHCAHGGLTVELGF